MVINLYRLYLYRFFVSKYNMDYLSNIVIYIVTEGLIEAFVEEEVSRLN